MVRDIFPRALRPPKDSRGYGPSLISLPPLSVNLRSLSDSPHPGRLEHAPGCKISIKVTYSQLIDINWPVSYSQLIQLLTVVKTIWVDVVRHRSASKVGLLSTQNISCSNSSVSHAHLTRWNPHVLHVSLFVANKGNKKKLHFFWKIPNTSKHISSSFQLTRQLSSNKADFFPN